MPQVQVLPYVPSFGEKLSQAVSQTGPQIAQGLQNYRQQQALPGLLKDFQDPSKSPLERVSAFMQLPENIKKSAGPVLAAVLGPQAQAEVSNQAFQNIQSMLTGQGGAPFQLMGFTNAAIPATSMPGVSPNPVQFSQPAPGAPRTMQTQGQVTPSANIASQQSIDANDPSTWPDQYLNLLAAQPGPMGQLGKTVLDQRREREKEQRAEEIQTRKEEREIFGGPAKKFLENTESYRENSKNIELALEAELDSILAGEVDPFSQGHLSELGKQFGLPNAATAVLETVGSKAFRTGQKTFLATTFKDAFRGATTTGQIQLASSLLAEAGAPREANLASLYLLQAQHMIEMERIRLVDEAKKEGISPYKIQDFVNPKLDDYARHVNEQYFIELKNLREEAKQ